MNWKQIGVSLATVVVGIAIYELGVKPLLNRAKVMAPSAS